MSGVDANGEDFASTRFDPLRVLKLFSDNLVELVDVSFNAIRPAEGIET